MVNFEKPIFNSRGWVRVSIVNTPNLFINQTPNGSRYAPSGVLVGGTRQRHFDGIIFKQSKLPKNAHAVPTGCSPTTTPAWFAKPTTCGASVAPALFAGDRVHAGLGAF